MNREFWLERWQSHQLGWHRDDVNPLLIEFWPKLEIEAGSKVFVPLCGKTLDMGYLAAEGYEVLGCELSAIAVNEFFGEAGVVHESVQEGRFVRHQSGSITILEGDVFDLNASLLGGVAAVYDRGALIALPPDMRRRYAELLMSALPQSARTLLLSLEYDQSLIGGPPFSVLEEEVRQIFGGSHDVTKLFTEVTKEVPPRFAEVGLGGSSSPVRQIVWKIVPR